MPFIEFKRGPLKGYLVDIYKEKGNAGIVCGHLDDETEGTIKWGADFQNNDDSIELTVATREPDTDEAYLPNERFYIHPSGITFLIRRQRNLRIFSIQEKDYVSPARTISGVFYPLSKDLVMETGSGRVKVPEGTPVFEIGFSTKTKGRRRSDFVDDVISTRQSQREGLSEYLRFLQDLQFEPAFTDVEYVRGSTHPGMARIATRLLGFNLLEGETTKTDDKDPKLNLPHFMQHSGVC